MQPQFFEVTILGGKKLVCAADQDAALATIAPQTLVRAVEPQDVGALILDGMEVVPVAQTPMKVHGNRGRKINLSPEVRARKAETMRRISREYHARLQAA